MTYHRLKQYSRNTVRCLAVLSAVCGTIVAQEKRFDVIRQRMVAEVIEAEGITNPAVLTAMRTVPRHRFVSGSLRSRAYEDTALAIGSKQTISPPYIVAYMTETIDPQRGDRILEIGTGSGYQAAVLAEIVDEVYSIEIVETLSKSAAKRLDSLGYRNIHLKHGDGYKGWAEHAPFDKIIVTCSPESIPQPLTDQLREGGVMIIPLGERYQQSFYLLQKTDGKLVQKRLVPTLFVPMTGESESQRRVLPDGRNPQIVNGDFELDENDDERVDGWHYQRRTEMVTDGPMSGKQCLRFTNTERGELSQALQGAAIDGRHISTLECSVWARMDGVVPGGTPTQFAGVVVHIYDAVRRELGAHVICRLRGTENWQQIRRRIPIPATAREMVIRIGLNGSTGTLDLDNLKIRGALR